MHSIKQYVLGAMLAVLASSPALADPGPWVETKTPLVGSTTFTGTARYLNPLGAGATSATFFGAQVFADQAGTAYIDISDDGATWNIASQATLSANTASDLSVPIRSAYYRVRVVNGGSDETVLRVFSSQTQSGPGGSAASGGGDASAANQTAVIGTKAAGTAAANSELVGGVFNTALPTLTNGQQAAAQFDSSGRLIVNIGAGASSGAVSQGSTTSGQTIVPMGCRTLTSAPTDTTAQTNMPSCTTSGALRTDASASTQPISAASLPLPTGAATATNQTNVTGTVAAGAAAANSQLTGCIYNSTEPSPTTGQGLGNQCDSKGRQRQVLMDAAGNTRGANVTASNALVVDGSAVTQPTSHASGSVASGAYASGSIASGAFASGAVASGAVASGALAAGAGTDGWDSTQGAKADSVCGTATGTCTLMALIKFLNNAATASTPAGSAVIGKFGVDQTTPGTTNAVQPIPGTTGGLTTFYVTPANSTNATNVKASAGTLYDVELSNNSATPAYVSFYNTAGTPTCGTGIVGQAMIPANATSGAGWVGDSAIGKAFSTGIGICVTTGIAGTGSVAASAYTVWLGYK